MNANLSDRVAHLTERHIIVIFFGEVADAHFFSSTKFLYDWILIPIPDSLVLYNSMLINFSAASTFYLQLCDLRKVIR